MKKLQSTLPNMLLSLGVITLVAGALLGLMNMLTAKDIAEGAQRAQMEAMQRVLPPFDNDPMAQMDSVQTAAGKLALYPAYKDGKFVGAAVVASSMNGFSGEVKLMVGFDADGTVRDYDVLQQAETPGLGAKMGVWFRDPTGARSILGRNPGKTSFYVTKDKEQKGEVDAITAATISSRAFLEGVRSAYEAFENYRKEAQK